MGDTDNSDFGSASFGKNCIYHVIPDAIRVPKMYILSMLEISRVTVIRVVGIKSAKCGTPSLSTGW